MNHHSGAGCARVNGTRQLSFPRLAEAYDGPPAAGSSSHHDRGAVEAMPPAAEAVQEGREAKYDRYRSLFREICTAFDPTDWDKRRTSYASLVALQGSADPDAAILVREVIDEAEGKDDPLSWFSTTVLLRLKDHDLWSQDLCFWFNKRKQRMDSLQSFERMFD